MRRLRWYGHTVRRQQWLRKIKDFQVAGKMKPGRPIKRWDDVIHDSIKQWNLQDVDPHDSLECCHGKVEPIVEWKKTIKG